MENELSTQLPYISIHNACMRYHCMKVCAQCSKLVKDIEHKGSRNILVNYKSAKVLFVKMKSMWYMACNEVAIKHSMIDMFICDDSVNIVDANDSSVYVPQKIYTYIKTIDTQYANPVLMVQIVKYLEYEKEQRTRQRVQQQNETELEQIVHGIHVSFFYDPQVIQNGRKKLYRDNKKAIDSVV